MQAQGSDGRVRQIESELNDVMFLTKQKDNKIQEMEKTLAEMRQKL